MYTGGLSRGARSIRGSSRRPASVQHRSQFGRKALRLPPLGITQLEPFLEAENGGVKNGFVSLKRERDEVT